MIGNDFGRWGLFCLVLGGCGNQPLRLGRDVVVDGDLTVLGDTEVAGSLDVGEDVTATDDVIAGGDLEVADDAEIDGDVMIDGDVTVVGDLGLGGEIVELPKPPPPPPADGDGDNELPPAPEPEPEPAILTATINESNDQTTFVVGESINLTVMAAGGVSPYDLRCLWPDSQFTIVNDSSASRFEFSRAIGNPGSGTINCQITAADGQVANVWHAITVE